MSRANRISAFGEVLRHWRTLRGMSQLALAVASGVSARHLSFIETGRSRPGKQLVLRLAQALAVPIRQRNELLRAAGLPTLYRRQPLSEEALRPYRTMVRRLLEQHEPYPAFALDGYWNVVDANETARYMYPPLKQLGINAIDMFIATDVPHLINRVEVGQNLLARLQRDILISGRDPHLQQLAEKLRRHVDVETFVQDDNASVITYRFDVNGKIISTFGAIVQFDSARDATLDELRVELYFPADAESEALFKRSTRTIR